MSNADTVCVGVNMRLEEGAIRELHWHKEVRRSSKSHTYRGRLPMNRPYCFGCHPQKPCIGGRLLMNSPFVLVDIYRNM